MIRKCKQQSISELVWNVYRLTKSLNAHGSCRIQHRSSVAVVRGVFQFLTFTYFIGVCVYNPQWFMNHFVNLRADSVNYLPLQQMAIQCIFYEVWDLLLRLNWYATICWSAYVHHWIAIAFCFAVLRGVYTPFATWSAFTIFMCHFPIRFIEVFRFRYSFRYPQLTRAACRFSYWWFIGLLISNLCGLIFLFTSSLLYHYNESIPVWYIGLGIAGISGFLWHDYKSAKVLWSYSMQKYELADFLNSETAQSADLLDTKSVTTNVEINGSQDVGETQ